MSRWKKRERDGAKAFGVQRNLRVNFGESGPDTTEHPVFSIEIKSRLKVSQFLKDGLEQAKGYYPEKLPLLLVYERFRRDGIVVMNLKDFQSLLSMQEESESGLDAILEINQDETGKFQVRIKNK
jgi:hypothetical protein